MHCFLRWRQTCVRRRWGVLGVFLFGTGLGIWAWVGALEIDNLRLFCKPELLRCAFSRPAGRVLESLPSVLRQMALPLQIDNRPVEDVQYIPLHCPVFRSHPLPLVYLIALVPRSGFRGQDSKAIMSSASFPRAWDLNQNTVRRGVHKWTLPWICGASSRVWLTMLRLLARLVLWNVLRAKKTCS